MRLKLRRGWLVVHRWIGLTVGLLFVLLGLTGSLLIFDHAIDEWLNPDLLISKSSGRRLPLGVITTRAEAAFAAAHPDSPAMAAAVSSPRVPNGVCTAWFQSGPADAPEFTMVYVDPATGDVTGQRVWGQDLMGTIYRLHYTLLGGRYGSFVVGIAGVVLMFSTASGIILWWPLWKSGWRAALAIRRGRRFNFDLHKTTGIVTAPILLVLAFSGFYMIFPFLVLPVLNLVSPISEPVEAHSNESELSRVISPEAAIAIAQRLFPDATFDHFHPPQEADGSYEIGLRQPGEVQKTFGRTQVWIDQYTGQVLAVRNPNDATFADSFIAWQFPLHSGEAFGLPGRLMVFVSGLVPAILYATGLVVWWRRKSPRRSSNRRTTAPAGQAPSPREELAVSGRDR